MGQQTNHLRKPLLAYGPQTYIGFCRFTPGASPAIVQSDGVRSLSYTSAGIYVIQTQVSSQMRIIGRPEFTNPDTTKYHQVWIDSFNSAAGTITIKHQEVLWASIASGPALADPSQGQIHVTFALRMSP